MPSTYTRNSGIEKIGAGEQSGSWGDTTNDNFDIIDRAINGTLNLSLSGASSTLTTSDGVLSDGQYKVLVLVGTPSGTHTITISPNDAQKVYMVQNDTAQSVVFTQGSGGNVTIAAGDSAIIYSDGAGSTAGVFNLVDDLAMSSVKITGGSVAGVTLTNPTLSGGSIDNTPIGSGTRSTGAFTTLAANGLATLSGGTTLSGTTQINGQLGLNGTNYGTAGDALISGGPGNPPQWGSSFPSGGIIMWSGSIASIPAGWALCNGANGTPNLVDRFIVGAGSTYAVGATGGAATVTLSQANLPAHTHSFSGTTSTDGNHSHSQIYFQQTFGPAGSAGASAAASTGQYLTTSTGAAGSHSHTYSGTTSSIGSGTAHENLPPYYALAYIMKI